MHSPEKRNAAPVGETGNRVDCLTGEPDSREISPTASSLQVRAARKIAAAFGLSVVVAGVIVVLAGIGGDGR